MALPALGAILGGGGGSLLGGALGAIGSIFGSSSQKNANDRLFNYSRNVASWHNDLSKQEKNASLREIKQASRATNKAINTGRDQAINVAGDTRSRSEALARGTLGQNLAALRVANDLGQRALGADRSATIGLANQNMNAGLRENAADRASNLRTADEQLRASLGYFEPAIGTGNNALRGMSDVLGLTKGGYSLEATPATRYLMETGRDTVEGGAAGAGGLYSGETLSELEKMRAGLASQDYSTQMGQLYGLAGLGQAAGNSAAGLRSGYRDATAAMRDAATGRAIGLRGDAQDAITAARNTATSGSNALRAFYTPQMTAENTAYGANMNNANLNYGNALTSAYDTAAARGINNAQSAADRQLQARAVRQNTVIGGASTTTPMSGQAIVNRGDAGAAGWVGATNALQTGLGNYAYNQGMNSGLPGGFRNPLAGTGFLNNLSGRAPALY